jgi:small subunit ribosomal protein S16
MGKKKQPVYRIVVADSHMPRDGRYIESLGFYNPLTEPSTIELDGERALYWLAQGAQPSRQVQNLMKIKGVWEQFESSKK